MTTNDRARLNASIAPPARPSFNLQRNREPVRLSSAQYAKLTEPLHLGRVSQDPKGFDHVEAWDIEATLTRIFGFGSWSTEVLAEECVAERDVSDERGPKMAVSWRVRMRLTVFDPEGNVLGPWENGTVETGVGTLAAAHELAYKAALSGALKRCAKALGNQFGLSLYASTPKGAPPRLKAITSTLNPPEASPREELLAAAREAGISREDLDGLCLQSHGVDVDHADGRVIEQMIRRVRAA